MTLTCRQERLLRRADHALRQSDPDLESKLSIFARLADGQAMPAREQLRRQRTGAWRVLLWPAAAATFLIGSAARGGAKAAAACGAAFRRARHRSPAEKP